MGKTGTKRLVRVLKILVTATFVCNLLALPLVPFLVDVGQSVYTPDVLFARLASMLAQPPQSALQLGVMLLISTNMFVWRQPHTAALTCFLLFCGGCTAVILWQARRVLNTILQENTFCMDNAGNMRRAGVCCLLISAAALARTVWSLFYYGSSAPLFTYNTLFVPISLMAGLLCLVMSALFRQAAELKAENDLTI